MSFSALPNVITSSSNTSGKFELKFMVFQIFENFRLSRPLLDLLTVLCMILFLFPAFQFFLQLHFCMTNTAPFLFG